jgi:hypothetical protein
MVVKMAVSVLVIVNVIAVVLVGVRVDVVFEIALRPLLHQIVVQQFMQDGSVNEGYLAPQFGIALLDALSSGIDDDMVRRRDRKGSRYFIRVLVNSAHLYFLP